MKHTLTLLTALLLAPLAALHAAEPPNSGPCPTSVSGGRRLMMRRFFQGRAVCGEEALTFWMQSRTGAAITTASRIRSTQFERLLSGDPQQVAKVNKEIQDQCRRVLADVAAWRKKNPHSRTPSFLDHPGVACARQADGGNARDHPRDVEGAGPRRQRMRLHRLDGRHRRQRRERPRLSHAAGARAGTD